MAVSEATADSNASSPAATLAELTIGAAAVDCAEVVSVLALTSAVGAVPSVEGAVVGASTVNAAATSSAVDVEADALVSFALGDCATEPAPACVGIGDGRVVAPPQRDDVLCVAPFGRNAEALPVTPGPPLRKLELRDIGTRGAADTD